MIIHGGPSTRQIYEGYFFKVELFPTALTNPFKKHTNEPQNIPTDTKNNIYINVCKKVYMRRW